MWISPEEGSLLMHLQQDFQQQQKIIKFEDIKDDFIRFCLRVAQMQHRFLNNSLNYYCLETIKLSFFILLL